VKMGEALARKEILAPVRRTLTLASDKTVGRTSAGHNRARGSDLVPG
jgi:hypothetical protein